MIKKGDDEYVVVVSGQNTGKLASVSGIECCFFVKLHIGVKFSALLLILYIFLCLLIISYNDDQSILKFLIIIIKVKCLILSNY